MLLLAPTHCVFVLHVKQTLEVQSTDPLTHQGRSHNINIVSEMLNWQEQFLAIHSFIGHIFPE